MTAVLMGSPTSVPDFLAELGERPFTILVATDGSEAANAAFAAARMIEEQLACRVHVLSVVEPVPVILPMTDALAIPPEIETRRLEEMRAVVEHQCRVADKECRWTTEVMIGTPAHAIGMFSRSCGADLVIVGLHKHGIVGRILGEETALEVARIVDIPVFVASPVMKRLPGRVLVAMGIEPDGLGGLGDILRAVTDTPAVSCIHVRRTPTRDDKLWHELERHYDVAMQERFADLERLLAKSEMHADLTVRQGDVTRELTECARETGAELVVVGIRRRRGLLPRGRGRLASRLLRQLEGSLLIVPEDRNGLQATRSETGTTEVLAAPDRWHDAMKGFTARNAGRVCTLEVDDPELGALVEARAYPLLGVDYDHRDGHLAIILGDTHGTERHLARSVAAPASVSILTVAGRDRALSVRHGNGQTLLTLG